MARTSRLDIPLATEQRAELDALAAATGLTPTAAGRLAITQFLSKGNLILTGTSPAGPGGDLDAFIAELRAAPLLADAADQLEEAFRLLDMEADTNRDAAGLFEAVVLVCRARGSLAKRLAVLSELVNHNGPVSIPRSLLTRTERPEP
jgi:hypothetical protein